MSLRSVQRILEAHQLAPHRIRTFKLSKDPEFVEKLRDIVVEDFFAKLTRRRLKRGVFRSVADLQAKKPTPIPNPSSGPPIPNASSPLSNEGSKR